MIYTRSKQSDFQSTVDGDKTDLYFLQNKNGLEMAVTNFGARVVELWVPDKNGHFEDIVLGHNNIDSYLNYKGERFLGSAIGRYSNRISKGQFILNKTTYQLHINNGPNSLHGGMKGFDMVAWDPNQTSNNKITFTYLSNDGEEGYPGNLSVTMTYELNDDNKFIITYHATADKATVINLTHHSFFNLHGEGNGTVNDHSLLINADQYTPIAADLIPTGELENVASTPMDFRAVTEIGSRLEEDFCQLKYGKGYDHNWILNRKSLKDIELAASISEPGSGRFMEVYTTQPGIQFYGGNFFDGKTIGKSGKPYSYRNAFALETQHFPDSVNHPHFPTTALEKGEEYSHTCIYKFGINKM
jgi:aldose 1-epimerase